jgi:CheY-like chemotaxis protein
MIRVNPAKLKRLLVVDDHAGIRDVFLFEMHAEEDFVVGEACDGLQALALVKRARPDLIMLDLLMPNLNGMGVLKRLRDEGFGDIPVVVMTGFGEVFEKEAVLAEPNVVDFLEKPFSYDGLADRIRRHISKGVVGAPKC